MPLRQNQRIGTKAFAAIGFALLPALAAYGLLWHGMRNLPIVDDYQAILEFALTFRQLPHLSSKLLWIVVAQHNDYKLIVLHVFVALQYSLTGHVNFTFLMVSGNLMILAMLGLYWKHSFAEESSLTRRIVLFMPICYLLFQMNWVENLDMSVTDLQTVPVLLFSLATLHFLLQTKSYSFVWACLCAVAACGSSANGFLLAPVGLLVLVPRRAWGRTVVWTVTFALTLAVYLYRYVPFGTTMQGQSAKLTTKLLFFVSLMGAAAENMSRFPVKGAAIGLGIVLLAVFAHACWRRYDRQDAFGLYTVVWVLLSCAMITEGRTIGGITLSLTGRYKVYSDMLLIFTYVYAMRSLETSAVATRYKRWIYGFALAASVILCAGSDYFGYKFVVHRRTIVAEGLREYEADPDRNPPAISFTKEPIPQQEPQRDRVLLNESSQTGVYKLPPPEKR